MKNKIKILAVMLIAALCAFGFAACFDSGSDDYSPYTTVRFYVGGEVYDEQPDLDADRGDRFKVPANPDDKDGKQFLGWFISQESADAFAQKLEAGERFGGLSASELPLFISDSEDKTGQNDGTYTLQNDLYRKGQFYAAFADIFVYEDNGDNTLTANGTKFTDADNSWWIYLPALTIPAAHDGKAVTKTGQKFSDTRAKTIGLSEGLKEIGAMDGSDFRHIEIPASVEKISYGAFSRCEKLEKVTLASGSKLRFIDGYAFSDCRVLTEFTMPQDAPIEIIGSNAFSGTRIREFVIPATVTEIGDWAFADAGATRYDIDSDKIIPLNVTLASGSVLEKIGKEAFDHTTRSDDFSLPESCDDIGSLPVMSDGSVTITAGSFVLRTGAIDYYNNYVRIKYKDGLLLPAIRMERGAIDAGVVVDFEYASGNVAVKSSFADGWAGELVKVCYNVKERVKQDGLEFVIHRGSSPTATVCGLVGGLTESVTVPASVNGAPVVAVGDYAFYDKGVTENYQTTYTLKSVTLPDSVKTIEEYAFAAGGLTEVNMPESLEEIKDCAFHYSRVERYPLDKPNMKKIGENALSVYTRAVVVSKELATFESFSMANNQKANVYTDATETPSGWDLDFSGYDLTMKKVDGKIRSVDMAVYSLDGSDPNAPVATLVYGQFADMVLSVPQKISDGGVDYPVKSVAEIAFYVRRSGAVSDESYDNRRITLPEGLKSVGRQAFNGSHAAELNLPDSLSEVGEQAFGGCNFSSIVIPASLTFIPDKLFENCVNLETFTLSASHTGLTSVARGAFKGTKLLEHKGVDGEVVYVGDWCIGFTERPKNVDSKSEIVVAAPVIRDGTVGIAVGAFRNELNVAWTGAEPLGFAIKKSDASERTVRIPNSVKYIGGRAFGEQTDMIFYIPASVENIGYAFYGEGNGVIGQSGAAGTIYCEASEKPAAWSDGWFFNGSGQVNVTWGANMNR